MRDSGAAETDEPGIVEFSTWSDVIGDKEGPCCAGDDVADDVADDGAALGATSDADADE